MKSLFTPEIFGKETLGSSPGDQEESRNIRKSCFLSSTAHFASRSRPSLTVAAGDGERNSLLLIVGVKRSPLSQVPICGGQGKSVVAGDKLRRGLLYSTFAGW